MKLAQTPFLGSLVAEHGPGVPQALNLIVKQTVLFTGAHTGRRTFGPQGQAVAIAIFKGVHLFLDNIGDLTDGALEQFGLLQNRKADFTVAVACKQVLKLAFQILPEGRIIRQKIVHAANRLNFCQRAESLSAPALRPGAQ